MQQLCSLWQGYSPFSQGTMGLVRLNESLLGSRIACLDVNHLINQFSLLSGATMEQRKQEEVLRPISTSPQIGLWRRFATHFVEKIDHS